MKKKKAKERNNLTGNTKEIHKEREQTRQVKSICWMLSAVGSRDLGTHRSGPLFTVFLDEDVVEDASPVPERLPWA